MEEPDVNKNDRQYAKCSILLNEQTALQMEGGKVKLAILPVRRKMWGDVLNDHFKRREEEKKSAYFG